MGPIPESLRRGAYGAKQYDLSPVDVPTPDELPRRPANYGGGSLFDAAKAAAGALLDQPMMGGGKMRGVQSGSSTTAEAGKQVSPGGEHTSASKPATQPGQGLEGKAFTDAIVAAGGAQGKQPLPPPPMPNQRGPGIVPPSLLRGAHQPDTAGDWLGSDGRPDVSQAGMAQNEAARQAIAGRHLARLAEIKATEDAWNPLDRDLEARQKVQAIEKTLPAERDLIETTKTVMGPDGKPHQVVDREGAFTKSGNTYSTTRPSINRDEFLRSSASPDNQRRQIAADLRSARDRVAQVAQMGDPKALAEADRALQVVERQSELMLSALSGRPVGRAPSQFEGPYMGVGDVPPPSQLPGAR